MPVDDEALHWKAGCPVAGDSEPVCTCSWPLWHVSVAVQRDRLLPGPVPLAQWTTRQRETVSAFCLASVRGVGDADRFFWEKGGVALHFRRAMSRAEALGIAAGARVAAATQTGETGALPVGWRRAST